MYPASAYRSRRGPCPLVASVAALLALPERAEGTVLARGEVLAFLVGATPAAVAHAHRPHAVLPEERLYLLTDLGAGGHISADPAPQDRLGAFAGDDSGDDFGRGPVVGP